LGAGRPAEWLVVAGGVGADAVVGAGDSWCRRGEVAERGGVVLALGHHEPVVAGAQPGAMRRPWPTAMISQADDPMPVELIFSPKTYQLDGSMRAALTR